MSGRLLCVGAWAPFDHLFLMERYPEEGETVKLNMSSRQAEKIHFGDCSINAAAVAANYGINVALATVAGEDFKTSGYLDYLIERNIDVNGVCLLDVDISGHNYLYFDKEGDGFCFSHLGAAAFQTPAHLEKVDFSGLSHIMVFEQFSEYTLEALKRGKRNGATTCISGMVETAGELAAEFLKQADILFINKSEYRRLIEMIGSESAIFDQFNIGRLFVTDGKRGAIFMERNAHEAIAPVLVNDVVDTTGAGDAFAAGTVSALIKGYDPLTAAQIGAVTSSFVVQAWGCQTRLPSWDEMRARYAQYYGKEIKKENE